MATKSFSAEVDDWVKKVEGRLEAVFKRSTEELFSIAQTTVYQGGHLPFKYGFLRNTFVSSLNGSLLIEGPEAYETTIAGFELGDKIFGGWTRDYALRMEYGFVETDSLGRSYNQAGFGFMAKAVTQWQAIVTRYAIELRSLST